MEADKKSMQIPEHNAHVYVYPPKIESLLQDPLVPSMGTSAIITPTNVG